MPIPIAAALSAYSLLGNRKKKEPVYKEPAYVKGPDYTGSFGSVQGDYKGLMGRVVSRLLGKDTAEADWERQRALEGGQRSVTQGNAAVAANLARRSPGGVVNSDLTGSLVSNQKAQQAATNATLTRDTAIRRRERTSNDRQALDLIGGEMGRQERGLARELSRGDSERRFSASLEAQREAQARAAKQNRLNQLIGFAKEAGARF